MSLFGFCAKRRVQAVLYCTNGTVYAGENVCMTPQAVCPREPGEGYEKCESVCGQLHHAEIQCLIQAGSEAHGGRIEVDYHYCCESCTRALDAAGVVSITLVGE